jgi:Zn-dependent M28 family amino/carboxypeptidase
LVVIVAGGGCQQQAASVREATPQLDAARAFEHVKRLVELGPRPSGSEAIKKAQQYIIGELASYGLKVIEDDFAGQTPRGPIPMKNIIGELAGEKSDLVLIAGHYDTKLQAGFVGANDGGSSAAAVLETARVLAKTKPEYTLWFVLFDGEEAVVDWSAMDGKDNTYGSRHLAAKLKTEGKIARVKALILFDMIGDKQLDIRRDLESTPWLVNTIWSAAKQIGSEKFFLGNEQAIADDHIPFRDEGVPVVDIIDFNYGPGHSYWHTNEDTLDKVSGDSIKVVGDVVIKALPEVFKRVGSLGPNNAR